MSLGGSAAAFAALRRPNVFGNVLSQSGAFWWQHPGDDAYEWLRREVERRPRQPLRFYLDVGTLEGHRWDDTPTQVEVNRNLRDALRAKGCPVDYVEFAGGHDQLCWRGTLADGLIALLGGSPRQRDARDD
jgi:enterochelin esterase family protein